MKRETDGLSKDCVLSSSSFFWERELSVNLDALYLNSTQKLDTKTETVWIDSYNINYHHGCILRV